MQAYTVRLATGADSLGIVDVIQTVYNEYGFTWEADGYHADLYDIEKHYLSQGEPFWVAEMDGKIVGTVACETFPLIPGNFGETAVVDGDVRVSATTCSVERLYVHPDARGNGIASALMEVCMQWAREQGHKAMEVWSDKRFTAAHKLYQKLQAKVVGERICPGDPDEAEEHGFILPL
jgi:GNAT superfamily N-acetyltransferase